MHLFRHTLLWACTIWLASPLQAQTPADFATWSRQQMAQFQDYQSQMDKEFSAFLRSRWEAFDTFRGEVRDPAPKPVVPPHRPDVQLPASKPATPKPVVVTTPPAPRPPVMPQPVPPHTRPYHVRFMEIALPFHLHPSLNVRLEGAPSAATISRYWDRISRLDTRELFRQLQQQRQQLNLDPWSYVLLVRALSLAVHPDSRNDQALLTWFVLLKEGMQARLAYAGQRVHLLVATEQKVFEASYLTLDNTRYYALLLPQGERLGQVYSYDGEYPARLTPVDMRLQRLPGGQPALRQRELAFSFAGQSHQLQVQYDQRLITLLDAYPQVDLPWYFSAPPSHAARQTLLAQLRPLVTGKEPASAVNLLLRFVQTAFAYQTDDQQFGRENYLFAEEVLHYPYSDCEDRSVLFAYLVRELLGLEVIGLLYPGHVATAVRLPEATQGDQIPYQGSRYLVADPTYIGADVGMSMPSVQGKQPEIIALR